MNGDYTKPVVQLTPEQLQALDIAERMIHDLLPHIDALEKCGEPCADLRRQAIATADRARFLREHWAQIR